MYPLSMYMFLKHLFPLRYSHGVISYQETFAVYFHVSSHKVVLGRGRASIYYRETGHYRRGPIDNNFHGTLDSGSGIAGAIRCLGFCSFHYRFFCVYHGSMIMYPDEII